MKSVLLPGAAAFGILTVGASLLFLLPLPEERAPDELSTGILAKFQVSQALPEAAIAELNREIEKTGRTRYRIFWANELPNEVHVSLDLKGIPVTECAAYIADLTGVHRRYGTAEGIVIDHVHNGGRYIQPSMAQEVPVLVQA